MLVAPWCSSEPLQMELPLICSLLLIATSCSKLQGHGRPLLSLGAWLLAGKRQRVSYSVGKAWSPRGPDFLEKSFR